MKDAYALLDSFKEWSSKLIFGDLKQKPTKKRRKKRKRGK